MTAARGGDRRVVDLRTVSTAPDTSADLRPVRLDSRVPLVPRVIFPEAPLAAIDSGKALDRLDALDIFRMLVAELALHAQAQRRSVRNGQQAVIHAPGEDRLGMECINQVDALVIGILAEAIGTVENDISGARAQSCRIQDAPQDDAMPFANGAPSFNAIVPGDLGPRRE